jgi:aryl carrier-like protein
VLGIEQVGIHDNFLDLGGDSIRSVRMVALAKKRGLNFTIQQVFHNQTIAELEREFNLHGGQTVPQVDTASFERSGMPWMPIVVNNS